MKFGVREICDVVLKARSTQKIGNKIFYKDEPVLYFDSLKTSSLEGAATTVYAQGGKGNARLMAWEGERTLTFNMEDALISPESLAILTGAEIIEASLQTIVDQEQEIITSIIEKEIEINSMRWDDQMLILTLSQDEYNFIKNNFENMGYQIKNIVNKKTEGLPKTTFLREDAGFNVGADSIYFDSGAAYAFLEVNKDVENVNANWKDEGIVIQITSLTIPLNFSVVDGWRAYISIDKGDYVEVSANVYQNVNAINISSSDLPDLDPSSKIDVLFKSPYAISFCKYKVNTVEKEKIIPKQIVTTHTVEITDIIIKNGDNIKIILNNIPSNQNNAEVYVMPLKNNEILSEPYIGISSQDSKEITLKSSDNLEVFNNCDTVLVDYYTDKTSNTIQIDITPDKFGGTYYLEASTLFRDINGVDMPAKFIIPKCKIQSNFTFTMASSGDPSTFNFVLDAFPDYTRFDKTKKVLGIIQIINSENIIIDNKRKFTPVKRS